MAKQEKEAPRVALDGYYTSAELRWLAETLDRGGVMFARDAEDHFFGANACGGVQVAVSDTRTALVLDPDFDWALKQTDEGTLAVPTIKETR